MKSYQIFHKFNSLFCGLIEDFEPAKMWERRLKVSHERSTNEFMIKSKKKIKVCNEKMYVYVNYFRN